MRKFLWVLIIGALVCACASNDQEYPVDSQTGRAIGAREISPEELKQYIDKNTNSLIIDVRRPGAFAEHTIKGAINIPLEQLAENLKNIPKDTALFFT
jgi:3-mercaptopyruvate sulfurtransferase SseA